MAEEPESESASFAGTLDDTRNIRHAERATVAVRDDTELRGEGGEGIVGYLGFGGRDHTEQGRFAGIRETDETDIREHFELHDDRTFLCGFTGLCIARGLIRSGAEMPVSESSSSTFEQHDLFVVLFDLTYPFACFSVIDHGTARNLDDLVFSVFSEGTTLSAFATVGSHDMFLVF